MFISLCFGPANWNKDTDTVWQPCKKTIRSTCLLSNLIYLLYLLLKYFKWLPWPPIKPASILVAPLLGKPRSMECNLRQRHYSKHRALHISAWSQQNDKVAWLYPVQLCCTGHSESVHVLDPITPSSITPSEESILGSDRQSLTLRFHSQAEYKSAGKLQLKTTQTSASARCLYAFPKKTCSFEMSIPTYVVSREIGTVRIRFIKEKRHKITEHESSKCYRMDQCVEWTSYGAVSGCCHQSNWGAFCPRITCISNEGEPTLL